MSETEKHAVGAELPERLAQGSMLFAEGLQYLIGLAEALRKIRPSGEPGSAAPVIILTSTGLELRFNGMDQDGDAIWTAPGGARIAWFRDPDGHLLSVTGL